jgi:hypothetical protein
MLEDLKHCNSIGDKEGILFFSSLIFKLDEISIEAIKNHCLLNTEIQLSYRYAILTFEFIGLIKQENKKINLTAKGKYLQKYFESDVYFQNLGIIIFKELIAHDVLDLTRIKFLSKESTLFYEIESFPLNYAIFRNLLYVIGFINIIDGVCILTINDSIESSLFTIFRTKKRKLSEASLLQSLEQKRIQGEIAEQWVYNFELRRLENTLLKSRIKIISKIDVGAGFDILSFKDDNSPWFDRFIEVKSYKGQPHFYWSKNELEMAQIKGNNYCLYIVDINKLNELNYSPLIILNPSETILNDSNWLIETQSMLITRVVEFP